jgi:hypothetical protein
LFVVSYICQRCLSSPLSTAELQRHSLRAIREFLQNEDRRLQKSQRAERVKKKSGGSASSTPKGKKKEDEDEDEEEEEDEDDHADEDITLDEVVAAAGGGTDNSTASWTKYQQDAADFLPALVSACETQVYQLALAPSALVRREALQLMGVILHQAVTNPVDAMPSLVAALTDREPLPSREAINIVTHTVGRKKEWIRFLEQRFVDGIRLSYQMQSQLWASVFDPLHRRNIGPNPSAPVFDRPPTDGFTHAYALIRKNAASRKMFCSKFINELMNVAHIGIFAREQVQSELSTTAVQSFTSPTKVAPLVPHPSLNGRTSSTGAGSGAPSPHGQQSPLDNSQSLEEEFPAFEPPTFVRTNTDPSFAASPSSFASTPSGFADHSSTSFIPSRPAHPLAFLAYLAGACTNFPFEDDESMHLSVHLSKVINTRGASLQALIQQTIVSLKRLNSEHVSDEEMELSQTMQLAQPAEDGAAVAVQSATSEIDQETLLSDLRLQCESAMAITILIRLRQWLQESYDLSGRYEEWNMNASGVTGATSATDRNNARVPLRLKKIVEVPLHLNDLPLDEVQAEAVVATIQHRSALGGIDQSPTKIAGRSQKSSTGTHARSASTPVAPLIRSIIPVICQAQFVTFNTSMERNAVFLAAKKRGHKRSATVGTNVVGDDTNDAVDIPASKRARTAGGSGSKGNRAGSKKKSIKRRRYGSDASTDEEDDDFMETDEAPRKVAKVVGGSKANRAARTRKKPQRIEEESEEEAEEESSGAEEEEEEDE